jgi:signal peptidase I
VKPRPIRLGGPRPLRRFVGFASAATLLLAWFLLLRPVAFGGPASYVVVSGASMEPHLHTGDLVIAHAAADYHVGDVVAYRVPKGQALAGSLVIHRIIGGDAVTGLVVQGDNKNEPDPWRPKPSDIVGSSWAEFPGSGRVLLTLRTPFVLAVLLGGVVGLWFFTSGSPKPRTPAARRRNRLARWRRDGKSVLPEEVAEP